MKKKLEEKLLLSYGFQKKNSLFLYQKPLCNSNFYLEVKYQKEDISYKVYDAVLQEEYSLFHLKNFSGTFLVHLHEEVDAILDDIFQKCSDETNISDEILKFVKEKYGTEAKYPWKGDPNYCTLTTVKNKWYALIMRLSPKVIGLEGKEKIYLLNLKHFSEKIENLVDYKTIFPAYHMNKKHWITVNLNSDICFDTVKELIEESYSLVNS